VGASKLLLGRRNYSLVRSNYFWVCLKYFWKTATASKPLAYELRVDWLQLMFIHRTSMAAHSLFVVVRTVRKLYNLFGVSVLGPIMFLLYMADLQRLIEIGNFHPHLYDDATIYGFCRPDGTDKLHARTFIWLRQWRGVVDKIQLITVECLKYWSALVLLFCHVTLKFLGTICLVNVTRLY